MDIMDRTTINEVETILQLEFKNKNNLITALTHSSYSHENKKAGIPNNERMEFLGDASLKLAVSEYLYTKYPDYSEGVMTKIRAVLISDKVLSEIAETIDIGNKILLSKNEKKSGGDKRSSILANAMEAIFGAIYLDRGQQAATNVINTLYTNHYNNINTAFSDPDYKSKLQEIMQQQNCSLPEYLILNEVGPDHDKTFIVEGKITINGREINATSRGKTKKITEQSVAEQLIKKLENNIR